MPVQTRRMTKRDSDKQTDLRGSASPEPADEAIDRLPDQPPDQPDDATNPARSEHPHESYAGRPDQGVKRNTGAGAGGATQWGGGNKNHPSRIKSRPPGAGA